MRERIHAYLTDLEEGATSERIAADALGLKGAKADVADKVVLAAIEGDRRFFRGADGLWALKPAVETTLIREAIFLSVGVANIPVSSPESEQMLALAGQRVGMTESAAVFPGGQISVAGEAGREVLAGFGTFSKGAVPAAFRLPRITRWINRIARRMLGSAIVGDGLCLYRMGRRMFPKQALPSLEALAEAVGLTFLDRRRADARASLQADVLLLLLEQYEARGMTTVEEILSDLHPRSTPARFEAFAFDEAYLKELPQVPGVYIMRDRDGQVIYVGKAVNLRSRVGTYFARRSERPEKTRQILDRIWSLEVEPVGSELEALLLEAALIRLCRPEFNTQVAVHERHTDLGRFRNGVLVLPSADPDSVELFCLREGLALAQVRVRQDLSDWEKGSEQIGALFFGDPQPTPALSEADVADLEILKSWAGPRWDTVNVVDMEAAGTREAALRVLAAYIRACRIEGQEKVWRV